MTATAVARLRDHLESRQAVCLGLLEELAGIESYATQREGVEAVGDVIARELDAIGFTTRRVPGARVPDAERWVEPLMLPGFDFAELAAHRVSRKTGPGRGRVLILGDLDTAFLPGAAARFPFRVADGRAYGPGVADMKGGLVVAVHALRALAETGLESPGEVVCVWSADEQAGSLTARGVIEAAARQADWAFCLECAREGGKLMGSRAQIGVGLLEVAGREAHAGSAYAHGASAIEAMARKITAVHALTDPVREIYLNVGTVRGGWRRSVVAGRAEATLDVRTPGPAAWDEVAAGLRTIAARVDVPGTAGSLRLASHRPAVPWTADTDRLLEVAREVGAGLGVSIAALRSPAAGSSAFVGPLGVPCLDGMGPAGGGLMTDQEHVVVATLPERAGLLAGVLHALGIGAWTR
ncbi:MAG TPA: M20/M25/M40 family metallo-hydrolase [Methylomirabilota bacterium]|jgi:glutamate carboxypeptidase